MIGILVIWIFQLFLGTILRACSKDCKKAYPNDNTGEEITSKQYLYTIIPIFGVIYWLYKIFKYCLSE